MTSRPLRLALVLTLVCGCSGSANLQFVSTNLTAIDPPPPTVHRYDPQVCYWWTEPDGSFCVAMQFDKAHLFTELGRLTVQMSLAFDAPPAGAGRNYSVGVRDVRGRFDSPLAQSRFVAFNGIVAVSRESGDRYRGRFRLLAQNYPGASLFSLTPANASGYLLFGTFEAVHDPDRGRRILQDTESGGWTRQPRSAPTSQLRLPTAVIPGNEQP